MQWELSKCLRTRVWKTKLKLPQWISDLDGGFYKQDETIEYATPVSHFVKDLNFGIKVMPNFSVTHDDQLLLKLQSKNNVITDEFNDALVDAIDLLENDHYTSIVVILQMVIISVWVLTFFNEKGA